MELLLYDAVLGLRWVCGVWVSKNCVAGGGNRAFCSVYDRLGCKRARRCFPFVSFPLCAVCVVDRSLFLDVHVHVSRVMSMAYVVVDNGNADSGCKAKACAIVECGIEIR